MPEHEGEPIEEVKARVGREMPRYKCHEEVHALKIKSISDKLIPGMVSGERMLTPEENGYPSFVVSKEYVDKYNPQPGGYCIVCQDGCQSYRPVAAFEADYTRI